MIIAQSTHIQQSASFSWLFSSSIKEWLYVTTTIGMNRRWRRKNVYSQLMLLTYYYCYYYLLKNIYILFPSLLSHSPTSRALRIGCSINSVNKHFTKKKKRRSTKKSNLYVRRKRNSRRMKMKFGNIILEI